MFRENQFLKSKNQKINILDQTIISLLSSKAIGKQGKVPTGKQSFFNEGSGPYQLYQVMGSHPLRLYPARNRGLPIPPAGARTQDLRLKRPWVPAQVLCLQ
jgi:hypothetical protein